MSNLENESYTLKQIDMITHASGLTQSKNLYRTHYCDSADNPDLLALVEKGAMSGPHHSSLLGAENAYFYLTEKGKDLARRFSGKLNAKDTSR